jgi:hypothetical protein
VRLRLESPARCRMPPTCCVPPYCRSSIAWMAAQEFARASDSRISIFGHGTQSKTVTGAAPARHEEREYRGPFDRRATRQRRMGRLSEGDLLPNLRRFPLGRPAHAEATKRRIGAGAVWGDLRRAVESGKGKAMVGTTGFEPATFCSRSRRATRLRHVPTFALRLRSRTEDSRPARKEGRILYSPSPPFQRQTRRARSWREGLPTCPE